ncbi:hypothetical protein DBB34_14600 [Sphaerisporangium cinnabarinum]|nr:hypothetical protein [Sphaerisporangium cinnabarinum]PTU55383.1 hypothetical protein DBB34_14600 [Sphaerisporangium cinnabarinum]
MAQRTEEEPFTRVKCTVPWCAHECTWRPDGEGWSRLHRVGVDGLVEVFAGETSHAGEGTELTPASVIVLGVPEELESAENTRDLAAALGRAALIQANHRVLAR